jgi:hypothetical protein
LSRHFCTSPFANVHKGETSLGINLDYPLRPDSCGR